MPSRLLLNTVLDVFVSRGGKEKEIKRIYELQRRSETVTICSRSDYLVKICLKLYKVIRTNRKV